MPCQQCGGQQWNYNDHIVTCDNGHRFDRGTGVELPPNIPYFEDEPVAVAVPEPVIEIREVEVFKDRPVLEIRKVEVEVPASPYKVVPVAALAGSAAGVAIELLTRVF